MLKEDDFPFLSVQNYESTLEKIESAWESFIAGEIIPDYNMPRNPIFESWKRSKQAKVPFDLKKAPLKMNKSELTAQKECQHDLYEIIDSYLDNIYKIFHDENMAVSFSNEKGIIMSIRAGKAMQEKCNLINYVSGSCWGENDCGTNSIGTSLYTGKPIQIYATEHYCKVLHTLNCSSALIKEPSSENVLGLLTLTTHTNIVPAHTLNWTISEAEKIQNAIQYHLKKESIFPNQLSNDKSPDDCGEFKCIIGNTPAFNQVINLAYKFSDSDMPVLITGETGTGKEVLARAIHNKSNRKDKIFLPVNCGAIPKELISSELYGYVEGAFTGTQKGGMMYMLHSADSLSDPATQLNIDGIPMKELLDIGAYDWKQGDTLEELAAEIGVPAENLVQTIAEYNEAVDIKNDPFGRTLLNMKMEKGPFYAIPRVPALHHTMGGLRIDTLARVLDTNGEPIPGLYAGGEVTGGIHGGNRLGGNAVTDTVVFGRLAAQSALQENNQ